MSESILRLPTVKARTGLSRSSIYAFVKDGSFPKPIALGLRSVGWLSTHIDTWIETRIKLQNDKNLGGGKRNV